MALKGEKPEVFTEKIWYYEYKSSTAQREREEGAH
jgi:hypothetical protein